MPVFGYALAFIFLATAIHLVDANYYGEYVNVYKCLHCSHSKDNLIPTDLGCYTSYLRTAREEEGRKYFIDIYSRVNITREAFFYLEYYDCKLIHSHFLFDPMSTDPWYAIPGEDFEFQNITPSSRFFNFTISPGVSKRFDLTIINDSLADYYREVIRLIVGIYVPGGRNHCCNVYFYIEDDDGKL